MALEDRYEIVRAIHIGQVSTSYEALHSDLNRRVLLKVIHPQLATDPELVARFTREGHAMAAITHPNVVKVFDAGTEDGLPYLALEWVDGGTLAAKMTGGPLRQVEVKRLAEDLLKGLGAVHRAGFLHRDLKPDNVMIGVHGEARLTDFSLAGFAQRTRYTSHDTIVGTPAYMAPEAVEGGQVDHQSDLYGLGVLLLVALTGSNPFDTGDPFTTLERIRQGVAPKLAGKQSIDGNLARLVDALLAKSPSARPLSAEDAISILQGTVVQALPEAMAPSRRWRTVSWVVGAGFTLAACITLLISSREHRTVPVTHTQPMIGTFKVETPPTPTRPTEKERPIPVDPATKSRGIQAHQLPVKALVLPASLLTDSVSLKIIVVPWGSVVLDGVSRGESPVGTLFLPIGKHTIEVTHPTLPKVSRTVELHKGAADTLLIDLRREAGEVTFSIIPWGYLFLDGDSIGQFPREGSIYWLAPGVHRLRAGTTPPYSFIDSLAVQRDTQVSVIINLRSGTMIATPSGEHLSTRSGYLNER